MQIKLAICILASIRRRQRTQVLTNKSFGLVWFFFVSQSQTQISASSTVPSDDVNFLAPHFATLTDLSQDVQSVSQIKGWPPLSPRRIYLVYN